VLPFAARHPRRRDRAHRPTNLERLEERSLLSFSPLGLSQPDLAVSGFGAPVAAWGTPYSVTVDVRNIGSSTIVEPFAQAPGARSSADAGPVSVGVFLFRSGPFRVPGVEIGILTIPSVPQNSEIQVSQTFTLPARPAGFPNISGKLLVGFRVVSNGPVPDLSSIGNTYLNQTPVTLEPPLPELVAVGLDVPPVMQPGDSIQPNIEIANFGAANTALQGPVTVLLVATPRRNSLQGAQIVDTYTIENLRGLSEVPQATPTLGDSNITRTNNIDELHGRVVTLPKTPATYFLTVVVDPTNKIVQIHNLSQQFRRHGFVSNPRPIRQVGPPIPNLPPAAILTNTPSSPSTNPFPDPPFPVNPI
jgi:hypothetical protein